MHRADHQEIARPNVATKSSLSQSQRHLIELMQQLNFGRIENLHVRGGAPVFDPPPRVIRKLKIGGDNNPRPEAASDDFLLKQQTVELLEALAQLGDGEVMAVEVRHGLAFSLELVSHPRINGGSL